MSFEIVIKPKAKSDIRKEESYLVRERDVRAVRKWQSQVLRFRTQLAIDPHRYPQADEAEELGLDLRELIICGRRGTSHRVLFNVVANSVIVQRIRQAALDRLTEDDL